MDIIVTLQRTDQETYLFDGDRFKALDDKEPVAIFGKISTENGEIGNLVLYELYNDIDFWNQCNTISGDLTTIAAAICGISGAVLERYVPVGVEYQPIYILDNITIHKEYRGKGIGTIVVKNLLKMVTYQFGGASVLFLCASDSESAAAYGFDSPEYKKGKRRLIRFYKKIGFKVIKDNILVYYGNERGETLA